MPQSYKKQILKIAKRLNFHLKKSLGQNFLIDPYIYSLIEDTIRKFNLDNLTLIEIGSGMGFLTEIISKYSSRLLTIEIDRKLFKFLKKKFIHNENIEIVQDDVVKILPTLASNFNNFALIGNIPYKITGKLLNYLCIYHNKILFSLLMIQYDVYEKLNLNISSKPSSLSILLDCFYQIKLVSQVSPESFFPPPKVDSALVLFEPKKDKLYIVNIQYFINFVRYLFKWKRKTLRKTLTLLKKENIIDDKFDLSIIERDLLEKRAEKLKCSEILTLFNKLKPFVKGEKN